MLNDEENERTSSFSLTPWIVAILLIMSYQLSLVFRLPSLCYDFPFSNQGNHIEKPISSCCVITRIGDSTLDEAILFSYSLNVTSPFVPLYGIPDHLSNTSKEILSQYYAIANYTSSDFLDCYPLIYADVHGMFNRDITPICKSLPFSSPPRSGDILKYNENFMVIDPKHDLPTQPESSSIFYKTNSSIVWNIPPSYFFVEDYKHDFLEFWLKHNSPIFVHYSHTSIQQLIHSKKPYFGTSGAFKIMKRIIASSPLSENKFS